LKQGPLIFRQSSMAGQTPSSTASRFTAPPIGWLSGANGIADDHEIVVHRKVNDLSGVEDIINPTGKLIAPVREADHPHPQFLKWHREFHAFAV